jgi:hypothetical protein
VIATCAAHRAGSTAPCGNRLHGAGRWERTPAAWFRGWEDAGIDMRTVVQDKYHWYDFEVLRYFNEPGVGTFWLDDLAMRVLSALHRIQRRLRHRLTGRSGPRFA